MANASISLELYNKESVKRLQEENPSILPKYTVSESKDLAYNKKQINASITSSILQGKSIDGIADDLQGRMESLNRNSAIKAARTAITNAQNAGSLSSMYELREMGIDVQKEWVATLDDRTRESHRELDGECRDLDEAFSNGLQYPGDSSGGASEVWNCRCTIVSYLPEYDDGSDNETRWSRDPNTGEREYVLEQTYEEWKKSKEPKSEILKSLQNSNIKYNGAKKFKTKITEEEIVKRISGGDETEGSCSSLALCYAGNKAGFDVLDYRGGESRKYFASPKNIIKITQMDKVKGAVGTNYDGFKAATSVLEKMKIGKEYYFTSGEHAAIVRLNQKGKAEYLELQSPLTEDNGFHALTTAVLKKRFGTTKTKSIYGTKLEQYSLLIDIESLSKTEEFQKILGYINTNKTNQKKGKAGSIK